VEEALARGEDTEWVMEQGSGEPVRLCAYFDTKDALRPAWEFLCHRVPCLQSRTPAQEALPDTDWKNFYKKFLRPFRTGPLHIVPEWMRKDYRIPDGHHGLYLDAGLAFGTGAHETTQLCLTRLVDFVTFHPQPETLKYIDAGCGSGILSLAAYQLGFRHIFACDPDPQAIAVSRENAEKNAIFPDAIDFQRTDIAGGLLGRSADLLSVNILAPVLRAHAELLVHTVLPGGTLSLSGILQEEVPSIRSVFDPLAKRHWQDFHGSFRTSGDWVELAYTRPQP